MDRIFKQKRKIIISLNPQIIPLKYIISFSNMSLMKKIHITIFSFIGIIVFYSLFISLSDITQFVKNLNLIKFEFLLLILPLHFFVMVIRAFRQKILFDSLGISLSFKEHFLIHFSGLALIMTPGGLGQTIKAYYLKEKRNLEYSKTISITLVERFYDILSIIPLFIIMAFFLDSINIQIISLTLGIILSLGLVLVKNKKFFNSIISIVPKKSIFKNIAENSDDLYEIFKKLTHGKILFLSLLLGLSSWVVAALAFYYIFVSFNIPLSFPETTIMSLVPITIGTLSFLPGGIIAIEVTMLGFLVNHGIDTSLSSTLILFSRITSIWFLTFIGIITTKIVHSHMK